ncbi:MAG: transglycosylase SLT domain-containing protein [Patescibacteria group bacterium]
MVAVETEPVESLEDDQSLNSDSKPTAESDAEQLQELIVEYSLKNNIDPNLPLAIAFCESSYRHWQDEDQNKVLRGQTNSNDVGLFQINEHYHLDKSRELGYDIYTLEGNIEYAMWLLKTDGDNAWHWSQKCWSPKLAQK